MKKINKLQRINAVGGVNNDNPTEPTRSDFGIIIQILVSDDYQTTGQKNPDRYGASPVRDNWYALIPQILVHSIKNIYGFIDADKYPPQSGRHKQELGCIGNARIIVTKSKMLLDDISIQCRPIYGIEFTNDLKCKGHIVLACTIENREDHI